MASQAVDFDGLIDIAQNAANGIFNDENIGLVLRAIIDDNEFEEVDEVLEDLKEFDQCSITSYTSEKISQNAQNNIKYKWDESRDKSILYQLLLKIFKDSVTDLTTLIRTFSNMTKQSQSTAIPNTLIECTNNHIILISDIVIKKLNANTTKKPINAQIVQSFLIEHKINGQMLSNMKAKAFMDQAKAYSIGTAKGRKIFNAINGYFGGQTQKSKISKKQMSTNSLISDQSLQTTSTNVTVITTETSPNPSYSRSNSPIPHDLTTEPEPVLSENDDRKMQNLKIEPMDFDDDDDELLDANDIRRVARDLVGKHYKKLQKKIQQCMKRNSVDGKMFFQKFNVLIHHKSDFGKAFETFFVEKIMANNKKYSSFRLWFIEEVKQMKDLKSIKKKNRQDFTIFVLDGFDEFVSKMFLKKEVNSNVFQLKGASAIATEISKECEIPNGAFKNLCFAVDEHIKSHRTKHHQRMNSPMWINRVSERILFSPIEEEDALEIISDVHHDETVQNDDEQKNDTEIFKFDALIKSIGQCNSAQIDYIFTKYILPDFMSNVIVSKNSDKLIEYFQSIDGAQISELKRKPFASKVANFIGVQAINGPALKMWTKFRKFDFTQIHNQVKNDENVQQNEVNDDQKEKENDTKHMRNESNDEIKLNDLNDLDLDLQSEPLDVKSMQDCSVNEMIFILEETNLFYDINKQGLIDNRKEIIAYFRDNQIDGSALFGMKKFQFAKQLAAHCDNKQLTGPFNALYTSLKKFDVSSVRFPVNKRESKSISLLKSQTSFVWQMKSLEQCSFDHIVSILHKYIFPKLEQENDKKVNAKIIANKDLFCKYFEEKHIDGLQFMDLKRRDFAADFVEFANNDKSLNGAALNIWKELKHFDFGQIDSSANVGSIDDAKKEEETQNDDDDDMIAVLNQLMDENEITNIETYKEDIISYFVANEINKTKFMQMERKEFAANIVDHCNSKKVRGCALNIRKLLLKKYADDADAANPQLSEKELPDGTKRRQTIHGQLIPMVSIDETKEESDGNTSSPPPLSHQRSKSAHFSVAVNGKTPPIKKKNSHKRNNTDEITISSAKSKRMSNQKLRSLDQNDFCKFITECVKSMPPRTTVETMIYCILHKHKLTGKQMTEYIEQFEEPSELQDHIQDILECNEVYFLKYLVDQINDDYANNIVPFENFTTREFANYVQQKSYLFPANAFQHEGIDGGTYCEKQTKFLIDFLRKHCGFKAGPSRDLITCIDKYPLKPLPQNTRSRSQTDMSGLANSPFLGGLGDPSKSVPYRSSPRSQSREVSIIDDNASDASIYEMSLSISVNPRSYAHVSNPASQFADHSWKIYQRENERHWRRIGERLDKVGMDKLLQYIQRNDGKRHNDDDEKLLVQSPKDKKKGKNEKELNKKMFIKQAKLVYKIEIDRFYEELYKDTMAEAFGWNDSMSNIERRGWIVRYELNKLRAVIIANQVTTKKFHKEMFHKEDIFCRQLMGFLPKKRRIKLWKKLKKDINKKKLHIL